MNRIKKAFIYGAYIFVLLLAGCEEPMENPESIDPIYSDLLNLKKKAADDLNSETDRIRELNDELSKLQPHDINKRRLQREIYNREKNRVQIEQMVLYYDVRAQQRKRYDKIEYLKAFRAKKTWPDPEEYRAYKNQLKLKNASRNWGNRIPPLTRYLKKQVDAPETAKKEKASAKEGEEE